LAIAGALVGCGGDSTDNGASSNSEASTTAAPAGPKRVTSDELKLDTTKASKPYKVAFVLGASEGTYFAALKRGGEKAAKETGVSLDVQGPPKYDAAQQASVINTILTKQPDFMAVEPVDADLSVAPLKTVNNAGIPIITMDTVIGKGTYGEGGTADFPLSYVGSDNVAAGVAGCKELAKEINGKGEVFIQADLAGDSSLIDRVKGCTQALEKHPDIKVVSKQYANEDAGKAQTQAEAVLQKYPKLAGIYAAATAPSEGTAAALRSSGKSGSVKFVAMDSSAAVIDALQRGDATAVIAQRPQLMGELSVKMGVAALEGQKDLPTFVDTGTDVVTKDNLSQFDLKTLIY
jgi:ribose transport system substrate-binding protein